MSHPELKAGPELDSFLAEHIMRWHREGEWWCDAAETRQEQRFAPSASKEDADRVFAAIRSEFPCVPTLDSKWNDHVWFYTLEGARESFTGRGPTPLLAICDAAIKFVEERRTWPNVPTHSER